VPGRRNNQEQRGGPWRLHECYGFGEFSTGVPWRRLMGSPARRCSCRAKPCQPRTGRSRANHSRCGFSRAGRRWVRCCVALKECVPMWTMVLSVCVWWEWHIVCIEEKGPRDNNMMGVCMWNAQYWSDCANFTALVPRARWKRTQLWHSNTVVQQRWVTLQQNNLLTFDRFCRSGMCGDMCLAWCGWQSWRTQTCQISNMSSWVITRNMTLRHQEITLVYMSDKKAFICHQDLKRHIHVA